MQWLISGCEQVKVCKDGNVKCHGHYPFIFMLVQVYFQQNQIFNDHTSYSNHTSIEKMYQ